MTAMSGHVYFATDTASGLIKIGFSGNAPRRVRELRRQSERRMLLLGIMAEWTGIGAEGAMHTMWQEYRTDLDCLPTTEWFTPAAPLIGYIIANAVVIDRIAWRHLQRMLRHAATEAA